MKSKKDRKPQPLAVWANRPQAKVQVPDLITLLVPDLGWQFYQIGGTDPIKLENPEGEGE